MPAADDIGDLCIIVHSVKAGIWGTYVQLFLLGAMGLTIRKEILLHEANLQEPQIDRNASGRRGREGVCELRLFM